MTDKKGEKLMKFGPEWLRNNLSRESSTLQGSNSSSVNAKTRITAKFKVAEHRYKREDLLALYRGKENPPEELKRVDTLFVLKSQIPIGLQFCPRRVRTKRPILPRCDMPPGFEVRPPGRVWNREHFVNLTRPQINYFQPRWFVERNWRQNNNLNKGPETDETWRNGRNQEYQKNKWNEKGRERRDYQRTYSNDSWIDDRHSPEDMLPEWANSEDILDETGTFDATGAFLPIINDPKPEPEENNNIDNNFTAENGVSTSTIQEENHVVDNVDVVEPENDPVKSVEDPESVNEAVDTFVDTIVPEGFKFDMEDSSYSMVEDYLNKLVQEDDNERNRSRIESNLNLNQVEVNKIATEPVLPRPPHIGFSNVIPPGLVPHNIPKPTTPINPYDHNGWFYQCPQNIVRGPYTSGEMIECFKAGFINNYTLLGKRVGQHYIPLSRLIELCGDLPFLLPEHITNNIFNPNSYSPTVPDTRAVFHENTQNFPTFMNGPNPLVKDFIDAVSLSMQRFNQPVPEQPQHTLPLNNMYPMNPLLQPRPNVPPIHSFQHAVSNDVRVENTLAFPFSQFPPPPLEHQVAANIPQTEPPVRNEWTSMNHHNLPWVDSLIQPKPSYVPIPMPVSTNSLQVTAQEPISILSHPCDDYLSGLTNSNLSISAENAPPHTSACNTQAVSTTVTNAPLWNNRVTPNTLETFDYNLSILAQKQKPIYAISPQQQQQQQQTRSDVELNTYVIQERPVDKPEPIISGKNEFEKLPDISDESKRKHKDNIKILENKKKGNEDKKQTKPENKLKEVSHIKPSKSEIIIKQSLEVKPSFQKKKQSPQQFAFNTSWNLREININNEINQQAPTQPKFIEKSLENILNPVINKTQVTSTLNSSSNPLNTAIKEKGVPPQSTSFTWANSTQVSAPNISLAEIQAEEQLQHAKLEKSASAPRIFHSKIYQKNWSNSTESNYTSIEGFWDTQSSKPKVVPLSKSSSSNGQPTIMKSFPPQPKIDKVLKVLPKVVINKKEVKEKLENNNDTVNKFITWAKSELTSMSDIIDVHDFVTFLHTVESPFEVEEYAKVYLGDTKSSLDFAKLFIQRRSQMLFSKSRSIPCDDLCSPAPAYNPSVDKREESKNKNKKKKGKMSKIDARILGFNATASENRFNIGNIDVP